MYQNTCYHHNKHNKPTAEKGNTSTHSTMLKANQQGCIFNHKSRVSMPVSQRLPVNSSRH